MKKEHTKTAEEIQEIRLKNALAAGAMALASMNSLPASQSTPTDYTQNVSDIKHQISNHLSKTGYKTLLNAMIWNESSWNLNTKAGDGGKAVGILQMWPVMVEEFNQFSGKSYTHEDAKDPIKAIEMAKVIFDNYRKLIKNKTGKDATAEQLARMWNGGRNAWKPQDGQKEENLKNYWTRVLKFENAPIAPKL